MKKISCGAALVLALSAQIPAQAQDADLAAAREATKKHDYNAAAKLLQPLVDKGNTKAMSMLGKMRLAGQGVIKDEVLAAELFRKGAEAGDAEAMYLYGRQLYTGNGLPRDENKAVAQFLKSAEAGNADGQLWYAISLSRGWGGLSVDKAAALPWLRRAAEQDQAVAQNWLGEIYSAGELVEKNPYEAISLFRKAALHMDPAGQRNLGIAYARGNGVARDDFEALKWLQSAAYLRDAAAQESVGAFYEKGRAVLPDLVAAHMWYALALARDPQRSNARTAMERVDAKLTPAQLTEAQNKVKQWPVAADLTKAVLATDAAKSVATTVNVQAAPVSTTTTAPAPAPAPLIGTISTTPPKPSSSKTGSGFVVGTGPIFVVSNHHVVKDCKSIRIMPFDLPAVLRAKDERNDLALLSVTGLQAPALKLRTGKSIRPGDDLVTLGFPLAGLLATGASVNTGTLTNLGGLNNDTSLFQISVPTQSGNSGGPVLDLYGQVVGVVVGQVNAVGIGQVIGTIPQNVNFAINTATLSSFLEASNVDFALSHLHQDPKAKRLEAADVGSLARRSTVKVECTGL